MLTKKQLEVVALLAKGHSQAQVAEMLHIDRTKVRSRYDQAKKRLGAHSGFQLGFRLGATMAEELGQEARRRDA